MQHIIMQPYHQHLSPVLAGCLSVPTQCTALQMFRLTLPSPHPSPFPCRVSVSPHTAHQIVRQYLLHYGYGDTLGAFDAEAGFRAEEEAAGEGGEGGAGEGAAAARPNGVGRAEGEDGGPCRCV